MSSEVNTQLLESAAELIDYWEGNLIATVLEEDMRREDWDALHEHTTQARNQMYQVEYRPDEVSDVS